ncbi:hypothetical protein [Pseudomonas bohemica]|uniref:hypothetical protein n=1 Tax=Pseudomonas bohemica TaxID=2044872 RepID=UPI000DA5FD4D|nr:hypothetical protein [Pseudomonas bohemica]
MSKHPRFYDFADEGLTSEELAGTGYTVEGYLAFTNEGFDLSGPMTEDGHEDGSADKNSNQADGEEKQTDHEAKESADELHPQELNTITNQMIALYDSVYDPALLDPLLYIQKAIRKLIDGSSAPEELKNRIHGKTPVKVSFRHRPSAQKGLINANAFLGPRETMQFTIDQIVTDSYRRHVDDYQQVQVEWPDGFPRDLIDSLESANLQESYKADVEQRLSTDEARFMLKLQAEIEVKDRLEKYAARADVLERHRQLALAYGRGEARLDAVEFRTRLRRVDVSQALYLRSNTDEFADGLLIFLGATQADAVLPLPRANRRWVIETSTQLRRLILERLPVYERLIKGHDKLVYSNLMIGVYLTKMPPLMFHRVMDPFETLQAFRLKRMLSDIDTLVSTDSERLTDKLLAAGANVLQVLSVAATAPLGGGSLTVRLLVSFLLGQGAAALEVVRGANADTPEEADKHYKAALFASIMEATGPLAFKVVGKTVSAAAKTKIATRVFRYLKKTRPYPGKPQMTVEGFKPPVFKVKALKDKVKTHLSGGPGNAQVLVSHGSQLLEKTVEGHRLVIYRGKVFRGDMRPPEEIFEEGFKLRTPAADIQKDIHQVTGVRGGFGGGHDALDLDGKGISTSVFYDNGGAGAYYYGGHKGGYTYVIDARRYDGYHLYQNHENARQPIVAKRIAFRPLEINYAHDIPGTAILGAYNAAGTFIANDVALRIYARKLAIRELRRLAAVTVAAGVKEVPTDSITAD